MSVQPIDYEFELGEATRALREIAALSAGNQAAAEIASRALAGRMTRYMGAAAPSGVGAKLVTITLPAADIPPPHLSVWARIVHSLDLSKRHGYAFVGDPIDCRQPISCLVGSVLLAKGTYSAEAGGKPKSYARLWVAHADAFAPIATAEGSSWWREMLAVLSGYLPAVPI